MESIKELRIICQTFSYQELPFVRLYARRFSIYFTKLFLLIHITANQVTLLTLLTGIFTGLIFILGNQSEFNLILGVITLNIWIILDHSDGEVARYTKNTSISGEYFDAVLHYIAHPFIIYGIVHYWASILQHTYLLYIGMWLAYQLLLNDIIGYYRLFLPNYKMIQHLIKTGNVEKQFDEVMSSGEIVIKEDFNKQNFSIGLKFIKWFLGFEFIFGIRAIIVSVTILGFASLSLFGLENIIPNIFEIYFISLALYVTIFNIVTMTGNIYGSRIDKDFSKIMKQL